MKQKFNLMILDQKGIGHEIGDFLNFIDYIRVNNKNCYNIILISKKDVSNTEIVNFWKINILKTDSVKIIQINIFLKKFILRYLSNLIKPLILFSGVSGTFNDSITLNVSNYNNYKKSNNFLEKLQNYENEKIALIMQRDSFYQGADPVRDTNIVDLKESISYLIQSNFYVIRYGKLSNQKIKIESPKFFDMTQNNVFTDFENFELIKHSTFALSSWYGPMELLRFFGIPTLFFNVPPSIREFPKRSNTFLNLQRVLKIESDEEINLDDWKNFLHTNLNLRSTTDLHKLGIKLVKNTSAELLLSTKEFLKTSNNEFKHNCDGCFIFKDLLFKNDEPPYSSFLNYHYLLRKNDFLNAKFCLTSHSKQLLNLT